MKDRSAEFDLVRELRKYVKCHNPSCSPKTELDYQKKYQRMQRTGFLPEHSACKQTFYAYRAALIWSVTNVVKDALRDRDKALFGSNEWLLALSKLKAAEPVLKRYSPIQSDQFASVDSAPLSWSDVRPCNVQPSTTKKKILARLIKIPKWREQVFEGISEKYRGALAICSLAGVRPSELEKGVEVWRCGQSLLIKVCGSKISANSGQPSRTLKMCAVSPEASYLYSLAGHGPITIKVNAQALCTAVERAGSRYIRPFGGLLSPYVYRHLFASALKAEGVATEDISRSLGHRSTKSQSAYGRACHGRKSSGFLGATADAEVRSNHRDIADLCKKRTTPSVNDNFRP